MQSRVLRALIGATLLPWLSACGADDPPLIDWMSIGFATPDDNPVWIRKAVFDDDWQVPGGTLGCCWREAGGSTSFGPARMPRSVRIVWDDESQGVIYEAETELPEDLTERALALPHYWRPAQQKRDRGVYLIIGVRDDGSMVVWLSNAHGDRNMRGRVLEVVGEAQARVVGPFPPE